MNSSANLTQRYDDISATDPSSPTVQNGYTQAAATADQPVKPHTVAQSLLLHLAPGAAVLGGYAILVPVVARWGLPSAAALAATGLVVIAPVQLAILRYVRRRPQTGSVGLTARVRPGKLFLWVLLEISLAATAFVATSQLAEWVRSNVFGWWPGQWALDLGAEAGYSRSAQLTTALILLVGTVIVAPIVEEVYFRGYLLPRMPAVFGRTRTLTHAVLFACYHQWTLWLAPTRILAILPLAYIARRTKDVRIGIVTHIVLNSVDLAVLGVYIVNRTAN